MQLIVTRMFLVVPPEAVYPFLTQLAPEWANGAEEPDVSLVDTLSVQLTERGWIAQRDLNEQLIVVGYTGPSVSVDRDPVLEAAVGWVRPGSFLEGYAQGNAQWQVRFAARKKYLIAGTVGFPFDPAREELLSIRYARPEDMQRLQKLSPKSILLEPSTVLVAERGQEIGALMQYTVDPHDSSTAYITFVASQVHGQRQGYPQALMRYLQGKYRKIVLMQQGQGRATIFRYRRIWKGLGFEETAREVGERAQRGLAPMMWQAPVGAPREERRRKGRR